MSASQHAFDLAGYLKRVGCEAQPAIVEVHRAHASTIPFENLDPQRGEPVSMALGNLTRKLVHERRGAFPPDAVPLIGLEGFVRDERERLVPA